MKKLLIIALSILPVLAFAGIVPIVGDGGVSTNKAVSPYSPNKPVQPISCPQLGYPLTSCEDGQTPDNFCPRDNTYFRTCACDAKFKYDQINCAGSKAPSGEVCGGKFSECGCTDKYRYTSENCKFPHIPSGDVCQAKYIACEAPASCEVLGLIARVPVNHRCLKGTIGELTCYKDCEPL